jgi:predicted outer membrane protein
MKKMRRCLLGTGLVVMIGMGGACSHQSSYEQSRQSGKEVGKAVSTKVHFMDQISLLNEKEIALGKLALKRSSNTQLRAFAHQLIENHEQNLASVEEYADAAAMRVAVIDLSTEAGVSGTGGAGKAGVTESVGEASSKNEEKLDEKTMGYKKDIRELSAKSGADFDKAVLEQIQKDQKEARELVNKGLKEYSDDAALAVLLTRSAPLFQRQEEQAHSLRESIE